MYEEEDDDLPPYYRRIFGQPHPTDASNMHPRLVAYLAQNQAIRDQLAQALASAGTMNGNNQQWQQVPQPNWSSPAATAPHANAAAPNVAPQMMHRMSPQTFRQTPYQMPTQARTASAASPPALGSPTEQARRSSVPHQSPAQTPNLPTPKLPPTPTGLVQTPANTVFPEPMASADFSHLTNGMFTTALPREAQMFLNPQMPDSSSDHLKPSKPSSQTTTSRKLHPSMDGMNQTLAPPEINTKVTNSNYTWSDPFSAQTEPTFSPDALDFTNPFSADPLDFSTTTNWNTFNSGMPTPGDDEWGQYMNFDEDAVGSM